MTEKFYRETPDAEKNRIRARQLLDTVELDCNPTEVDLHNNRGTGFAYIDTFISQFELEFQENKFTAKLMKIGMDDLFFVVLPEVVSLGEKNINNVEYFNHHGRHMAELLSNYDDNFQEAEPDLYKRWAMLNALSHISRFSGMDLLEAKRRYEEIGENDLAQRAFSLAREYFTRGKEKLFTEEFRLKLVKETIEELLMRFPDPLLSEEERNSAIEEIKQYLQGHA
jgi:ribosomal protein S17E